MSIESDLFSAIHDLTDDRVYPDVGPENCDRPYITYQQVGGDAINFVDPTLPGKHNSRMQINVWADTRLAAAVLSRQIEDRLRVLTALQTSVLGAPVSVFEMDTRLYGTRQDFSFWI